MKDLEKRAISGSNNDLFAYSRAFLKYNFPELFPNGLPKLVMGEFGSDALSRDNIQKTALQASNFSYEFPGVALHFLEKDVNSVHESMSKENTSWVQDLFSTVKTDGSTVQSPSVSAIGIRGDLCTSCNKPAHTQCSTSTPDSDRESQIDRFRVMEHETGHLLRGQLGVRNHFKMAILQIPGQDQGFLRSAEETAADSYAVLRVMQVFGAEGIAYSKKHLAERNSWPWHEKNFDYFPHKVMIPLIQWAEANPQALANSTPRQLLEHAARAVEKLAPDEFAREEKKLRESTTSYSGVAVQFRALANKYAFGEGLVNPPEPELVSFDKLYTTAEIMGERGKKDLTQLNPLRKDTLTCETILTGKRKPEL